MKLSIFTVSTPDLTPEELTAAAKAAGLQGIEWRFKATPEERKAEKPSYWGNNLCSISHLGDESEWDRFKRATEAAGLQTTGVTPYLAVGDLEATEHVLRAARYMNAKMIRLGVPGYSRDKNYNDLLEKGRSYLREAEALCKQYGVKGLVETHHNTIVPSASAAYRLVEGLDPEWIGVLFDPGNMVHEGYENHRMGMQLLGPYLAHVHIKNAGWFPQDTEAGQPVQWRSDWAGLEKGIVSWRQMIDDLRSVGYDGWLGLEDFSGELDSVAILNDFARIMNGLINEDQ
ncbi:sugar phosphate isomerase/epimerase family protein [Paenibacillus tarimensis]